MADRITGDARTRVVRIDGRVLDPARSQKVYNHSPDGFCWGYHGSGPSQLAMALLIEYGVPAPSEVLRLCHPFKRDVIARLPMDQDFEISSDLIMDWLAIRKVELGGELKQ